MDTANFIFLTGAVDFLNKESRNRRFSVIEENNTVSKHRRRVSSKLKDIAQRPHQPAPTGPMQCVFPNKLSAAIRQSLGIYTPALVREVGGRAFFV